MSETSLVDAPTLPMSARRREVLDCLEAASGPLSVVDVAGLARLNANTARFHLDGLVSDGLADRSAEERETPGRRRILYSAQPDAVGPRSYRLLAEMLIGLVASCLLYTSDAADDLLCVDLGGRRI